MIFLSYHILKRVIKNLLKYLRKVFHKPLNDKKSILFRQCYLLNLKKYSKRTEQSEASKHICLSCALKLLSCDSINIRTLILHCYALAIRFFSICFICNPSWLTVCHCLF